MCPLRRAASAADDPEDGPGSGENGGRPGPQGRVHSSSRSGRSGSSAAPWTRNYLQEFMVPRQYTGWSFSEVGSPQEPPFPCALV